jgi:hypothetical protein
MVFHEFTTRRHIDLSRAMRVLKLKQFSEKYFRGKRGARGG